MNAAVQIENIKISNFTNKLHNELNYLKDENNSTTSFTNLLNRYDRIKVLETFLEIPLEQQTSVEQQRENMTKEMSQYVFRKQWNKLYEIHKVVKIKEYVKEHVKDQKMQDEIIEKLVEQISNGMINTKKYVVYDPNAEKILTLPCLIIDEEKKTYQIKVV